MTKRSLSYDAPARPARKRVTRRTKEEDDQEPVVRESAMSVATLTPGSALSDLSNLSLEAPTTGWYGYDGLSTGQGFLEVRRRQKLKKI